MNVESGRLKMTAQLREVGEGKMLEVLLTGKLVKEDYDRERSFDLTVSTQF